MARQTIGRREYLTMVGAGSIGSVAGCGRRSGTTENPGTNDIVIWVRDTDATATITVENASTGETLFDETDTFSELLYPEDGPNARYENVFGTETVKFTFDVRGGPEQRREFADREFTEIHVEYTGSIEFSVTQDRMPSS